MNLVLLGFGKTGSLVAEVAKERGHQVLVIEEAQNKNGAALTRDALAGVDAVIDFTTPEAVIPNIEACVRAGVNMVVGTTGWYGQLDRVQKLVEEAGTGFIWASNFSIGVNLFFHIVHMAANALKYGYNASIMERHHTQKKDAPSGTAVVMQRLVEQVAGKKPEITSLREGETVGLHVMLLDSPADTIMLTHDAKNRRGFAQGAVRAAEWLAGKKGFYEFAGIFDQLR
jgi:4-hydroxy-tetrahydrodipicolinate reductase